MMDIMNLRELLIDKGRESYGGESVSQAEHALQCATLARQHGCAPSLVAACLLHDVGHQLDKAFSEQMPEKDRHHEVLGAKYLAKCFGPEVTQPILLHVQAKRYLCTTDPDYFAALSAASLHSLKLQGGPLSQTQCKAFENEPYFQEALLLRRFDEKAKDPNFKSEPWEAFEADLQVLAQSKIK